MKRSGFTMVELIFVIVIIGILAATALPKFNKVSTNAKIANFTKIIGDIESGAISAYTNEKQLNENNNTQLSDILSISGNKDWNTTDSTGSTTDSISDYRYHNALDDINATITLNNGADANLTVDINVSNTTKVGKGLLKKLDFNTTTNEYKRVYTLE